MPKSKSTKKTQPKPKATNKYLFALIVVAIAVVGYFSIAKLKSSLTPEPLSINKIATTTVKAPLPTLAPTTQRVLLGPPAFIANFANYWETRYVEGDQSSRATGSTSGLSIVVKGGSASVPASMNIALPYSLLTTASYSVEVETQLAIDNSSKAWVRLATNVTDNGYYLISLYPENQSYEVQVINLQNPTLNKTYTGSSTSIGKDSALNKIRVDRNPTNGVLEVLINNASILKISDMTHVGGINKLYLTSYNPSTEATFKNFKISPITSILK